jgi:hypothetical protein
VRAKIRSRVSDLKTAELLSPSRCQ